ncbi:hypothetical protein COLO4_07413 [Corchorus olitorius]|uniref:Uncharacterized protein n=1 Tax=Corchorus olitorius TaxID=93759 RepID=A0A1R3KJU5_9ROSI|nr:hypothetical protein COLO4_07413 [Corchorus olitorius]
MPELLFLPQKLSQVLRLIAFFSNPVPTASEVASNRLKQMRPEPTFFLKPGEINHRVKPNLEFASPLSPLFPILPTDSTLKFEP